MSLVVPRILLHSAKWSRISSYNLHTTRVNGVIRTDNERKPEAKRNNPNKFGPLTNLPDYTYLDGRPTPLGARQLTRVKRQREYAQKILTAINEVDFAKERYRKLTEAEANQRKSIIDGKFKPKGNTLLTKS